MNRLVVILALCFLNILNCAEQYAVGNEDDAPATSCCTFFNRSHAKVKPKEKLGITVPVALPGTTSSNETNHVASVSPISLKIGSLIVGKSPTSVSAVANGLVARVGPYPFLHALIVDDTGGPHKMLRNFCERCGVGNIHDAGSGKEAVQKFKDKLVKETFVLILMDFNMGEGENGIQATKEIREAEKEIREAEATKKVSDEKKKQEKAKTKLVIVSISEAHADKDIEAFKSGGMDGVFPKPFNFKEFCALLKKHFG